jgi:hypothetical protein
MAMKRGAVVVALIVLAGCGGEGEKYSDLPSMTVSGTVVAEIGEPPV